MSFFNSFSHFQKRNESKHMGPKYGGRSTSAQMYGSHPAAGYRNGQYSMGGPGRMMGLTLSETASRVPSSVKIVTALPESPAPTGTQYTILKGCAEVGLRGNVTVTYEDSTVDDSWGLTGNTLEIQGVKHHELGNLTAATEGVNALAYVPLCLIENTFRPLLSGDRPPASNILAACIEVVRNGNGAIRVIFEDGTTREPEDGFVLTGNEPIINGVKHFEFINSIVSTEAYAAPMLAPLCLVEGTLMGPSTDPVPGVMTVAKIPIPEDPPQRPVPARTAMQPQTVRPARTAMQPQPTRPAPTRVPPSVAVPRPAPAPRPATPSLPPLPRPPAPAPDHREAGDVYGVPSFQQLAQASQDPRCY